MENTDCATKDERGNAQPWGPGMASPGTPGWDRERGFYPRGVTLDEEKRRWRLCHARALEISEQLGGNLTTVRMLTSSYYRSDIPTGDGDADLDGNDL